ncbi:MAG TPA: serine hydrolase domain-containing protein [Sphingomicrobium sp.]|nr:serine hydrolase domain-containing protein [Sphingomicrobium sp.]
MMVTAAIGMVSAAPATAVPADFAKQANAVLASAYAPDAPGAAAIVMDDGKVVYATGRGLADVSSKRPIGPDTVFRLGSITKQFTAALVLQLVEEGKLSLSDPLSKFLPDYPKPGADTTVAQLLNHTSGIQSYTGIAGWMAGPKPARAVTTESLIAEFKDMPSEFDRGTKWDYNNSGYVLLGAIIEKVTGKAWHEALAERITRPLGLTSIRYGVGEEKVPGMATGHTLDDKKVVPSRPIHMSVPHAAGALLGNVRDLAKWSHALHHGKVVKSETYRQMITKTRLGDGTEHPYAFGLRHEDVRDRKAIGHGGGIFGFSTYALYVPSEDVFVAVLTNSDAPQTPPSIATQRLAALAINNPYPSFARTNVAPAAIEPLFGLYKSDLTERRFFARDGKLFTRRADASDMPVYAAGDDRFFYGEDSLTWFKVKRDAFGKHVMEMYHGGGDEAEVATRIGPVPPEAPAVKLSQATLKRYAGTYRIGPAPVVVALGDDGRLTVKLGQQQPVAIEPLSETEFRAIGPNAKVRFESAGNAVSRMVLIQNGREQAAERVN